VTYSYSYTKKNILILRLLKMHLEGTTSTEETPIEARDLICPICMSKNNYLFLNYFYN
jgi:hypothetical protein